MATLHVVRVFCAEGGGGGEGIPEDEATGSAAIKLCAELGREIKITQGRGSRLLARPAGEGAAEVGGTVELEEIREYAVQGSV